MVPQIKPDTDRDETRPDPDNKSLEATLMDEFVPPHSNANGKLSIEVPPQEFALFEFLRSYGAIMLAAGFGVLGSLAAAGFIAKPATSTSVDELKSTLTTYIDSHEKIDLVRTETLTKDLKEVNASLRDLLDRARLEEIHQAKLEAKVEDVIRILAIPAVPPPPNYVPPKTSRKPVLQTAP
jgi:hypothetical protein